MASTLPAVLSLLTGLRQGYTEEKERQRQQRQQHEANYIPHAVFTAWVGGDDDFAKPYVTHYPNGIPLNVAKYGKQLYDAQNAGENKTAPKTVADYYRTDLLTPTLSPSLGEIRPITPAFGSTLPTTSLPTPAESIPPVDAPSVTSPNSPQMVGPAPMPIPHRQVMPFETWHGLHPSNTDATFDAQLYRDTTGFMPFGYENSTAPKASLYTPQDGLTRYTVDEDGTVIPVPSENPISPEASRQSMRVALGNEANKRLKIKAAASYQRMNDTDKLQYTTLMSRAKDLEDHGDTDGANKCLTAAGQLLFLYASGPSPQAGTAASPLPSTSSVTPNPGPSNPVPADFFGPTSHRADMVLPAETPIAGRPAIPMVREVSPLVQAKIHQTDASTQALLHNPNVTPAAQPGDVPPPAGYVHPATPGAWFNQVRGSGPLTQAKIDQVRRYWGTALQYNRRTWTPRDIAATQKVLDGLDAALTTQQQRAAQTAYTNEKTALLPEQEAMMREKMSHQSQNQRENQRIREQKLADEILTHATTGNLTSARGQITAIATANRSIMDAMATIRAQRNSWEIGPDKKPRLTAEAERIVHGYQQDIEQNTTALEDLRRRMATPPVTGGSDGEKPVMTKVPVAKQPWPATMQTFFDSRPDDGHKAEMVAYARIILRDLLQRKAPVTEEILKRVINVVKKKYPDSRK